MKPWDRRKQRTSRIDLRNVTGPWLDIGDGECASCHVVRRLYRPVARFDVYLCAPCTQPASRRALSDREEKAA